MTQRLLQTSPRTKRRKRINTFSKYDHGRPHAPDLTLRPHNYLAHSINGHTRESPYPQHVPTISTASTIRERHKPGRVAHSRDLLRAPWERPKMSLPRNTTL